VGPGLGALFEICRGPRGLGRPGIGVDWEHPPLLDNVGAFFTGHSS
jgi:hypothetical protein